MSADAEQAGRQGHPVRDGTPVVLITGASGRIGRSLAVAWYRRGCRVAAQGRNRGRMKETAKQCRQTAQDGSLRDGFLPLLGDLTEADTAAGLVETTVQRWGRIDLVVACAGVFPAVPLAELEPEEWSAVLESNLSATARLVRAAVPVLERHGGTILFVGSEPVTRPVARPDREAYYASKGGVVGLARGLRASLAEWGVDTLVVHPGWTVSEDQQHDRSAQLAAGEFAEATVHLVEASRMVTLGEVTVTPRRTRSEPLTGSS
ncbi:SDR family oxidoreductase [Haloechinothrix sp. LS1_15]|uniref:SDR family oxidoreductase n=1 Tax=Haloechinothrix sp. LS1_15 TaxID=2652248 RepID=UPI002944F30B|nr:SDR family oxidoreductase [Haloechinothrix sp. LS1_15]MDV6011970.1 SDR family oxidoreductase [Haloechinothrix sp. LS1_15]